MRRFRGIAALVLALALVLAAAGCAKKNEPAPVVPEAIARVNGEDISKAEFERLFQQVINQYGTLTEEESTQYRSLLLDMMIESALVTQEAERLGADLSDAAIDARMPEITGGLDIAAYEQQLIAAGLTLADARKSMRDRIAEDFISELASQQTSDPVLPEPYSLIDHILVNDQAFAQQLYEQIVGGADFATLASANSSDTVSAAEGGRLGWAPTSAYVPEFATAADALKVGQVSEPVQSSFGWHIIRKVAEVPAGTPLSATPAELSATILANGIDLPLENYVADLRGKATIEYLDESLKPADK